MQMPMPHLPGMYSGGNYSEHADYSKGSFRPPSLPKAQQSDVPTSGQKCHHVEMEMEELRHPTEYKTKKPQSVPRSSVPAKRVPHCSPSPDIREALSKEETVEEEEPILL